MVRDIKFFYQKQNPLSCDFQVALTAYQPGVELKMVPKNGDMFLSDLVPPCSIGSTEQHIQMAT